MMEFKFCRERQIHRGLDQFPILVDKDNVTSYVALHQHRNVSIITFV